MHIRFSRVTVVAGSLGLAAVTALGGNAAAAVTPAAGHNAVALTGPTLTANQPPLAVTNTGSGTVSGPISPITLADDSAAGPLTFTLAGHGSFDTTHDVTVTVTSGTATVSATSGGTYATTATVTPTATTVTVYVTSDGTPSTFQLTGGYVNSAPTDEGLVTVSVGDGTATYGPVTATASVGTDRIAGTDRYGTAAALFDDTFSCAATANKGTNGDGTSVAIIARGDTFPDALASDYGAGQSGSGILLTQPTVVPAATLAELKSAGVTDVLLVGGTTAISASVENTLKNTEAFSCTGDTNAKISVDRIAGANRYETAAALAVALSLDSSNNPTYVGTASLPPDTSALPTAIVATGTNFADALSAGPMAYWGDNLQSQGNGYGFPLLLTTPTSLQSATKTALQVLKIKQVIVVGGPFAISNSVANQIAAMGINVIRKYGSGRAATATAIAGLEVAGSSTDNSGLGYSPEPASLARGDQFPDALAGGPWAGSIPSPILLTSSPTNLGSATRDYLTAATAAVIPDVVAFGGEVAVSPATVQAAANALTGGTTSSSSLRPSVAPNRGAATTRPRHEPLGAARLAQIFGR